MQKGGHYRHDVCTQHALPIGLQLVALTAMHTRPSPQRHPMSAEAQIRRHHYHVSAQIGIDIRQRC